jgi:hypothetical protein
MEGNSTPSVSSKVEEKAAFDVPEENAAFDVPEEKPVFDVPEVKAAFDVPEEKPVVEEKEVEEMPFLEKTSEYYNPVKPVHDPVYVKDIRRIAIYSEDGQESIHLSTYADETGAKRIILNNVDISLADFRAYFNSMVMKEEERNNELLYVGIHASFMTGFIVLLVAFGLALIKTEFPSFASLC